MFQFAFGRSRMNKPILLDFDGVVFHNEFVHDYVARRSVEYIQTRSKVAKDEALRLNKVNYKEKGHTALYYGNAPKEIHLYNYSYFKRITKIEAIDQTFKIKQKYATY